MTGGSDATRSDDDADSAGGRHESAGLARGDVDAGLPVQGEAGKGPEAFRTISEVAEDLDLPQHVLRFWETRFAHIRPLKRGGSRRYYRPQDVALLRGIRELLYGQGYTIKGVQRILKEQGPRHVAAIGDGRPLAPVSAIVEEVPRATPSGGANAASPRSPVPAETPPVAARAEPAPRDAADSAGPQTLVRRGSPARTGDDDRGPGASPRGATSGPRPAGGLGPDDIQRLNALLGDLLECKRMLDQAR